MSQQEADRQSFEPRELSTPRSAAAAGLVFALLFTASLMLARYSPSLSTTTLLSSTEVERGGATFMAFYLVPFSGIAFLWFIGVIRDRIGVYEDKLFATVFLGSGILFVAMLFAAAAVVAALLTATDLTPETEQLGRSMARSLLYVYAARSAGVFTMVTSTIVLRTRATPRWAAVVGFVTALALLLTIRWYDLVILLFPAWVALLSIMILRAVRRGRAGAAVS